MELARSLDTVGAITRSVDDAWLLDAVLSGHALSVRQRSVKGLRLAVPTTLVQDELDADVSKALLDLPFDHIFFTGSPMVGKYVMGAAAKAEAA
jgi:Asp-tRNA(Asn)/Glu-tRNA(Gln) amidotransferase A subunit family amidase